jgi:hypothetical protein
VLVFGRSDPYSKLTNPAPDPGSKFIKKVEPCPCKVLPNGVIIIINNKSHRLFPTDLLYKHTSCCKWPAGLQVPLPVFRLARPGVQYSRHLE